MLEQGIFKLKKKCNKYKGFMLVDAIVSLMLVSIFIIIVLSIQLNISKIKNYNLVLKKYIDYTTKLRMILLENFTYEEIMEFDKEDKKYINEKNINIDILSKNNINNILENECDFKNPYIKITVNEFEENIAMKIYIEFFYDYFGNQKTTKIEFVKGNYL